MDVLGLEPSLAMQDLACSVCTEHALVEFTSAPIATSGVCVRRTHGFCLIDRWSINDLGRAATSAREDRCHNIAPVPALTHGNAADRLYHIEGGLSMFFWGREGVRICGLGNASALRSSALSLYLQVVVDLMYEECYASKSR